jgi:hypothetical protein
MMRIQVLLIYPLPFSLLGPTCMKGGGNYKNTHSYGDEYGDYKVANLILLLKIFSIGLILINRQ